MRSLLGSEKISPHRKHWLQNQCCVKHRTSGGEILLEAWLGGFLGLIKNHDNMTTNNLNVSVPNWISVLVWAWTVYEIVLNAMGHSHWYLIMLPLSLFGAGLYLVVAFKLLFGKKQ
jgi:hypothetical protein